ncbi:hypothetical protein TNCV_2401281 [Trichonephila clavipes]|nr:hypothetical protein TNCV_2401281 [Trichonephila clavipes]
MYDIEIIATVTVNKKMPKNGQDVDDDDTLQGRSYRSINDTGPPSYRGLTCVITESLTGLLFVKKGHRRSFDTGPIQNKLRQHRPNS